MQQQSLQLQLDVMESGVLESAAERQDVRSLEPRDATAALLFDRVGCEFRSPTTGALVPVLRDVTISVAKGEFVSVVGPTGCGKSTLLNLAAGLLFPTSGAVRIFGQELNALNKRAGYMFQADALMPWRTALENVTLGLEFAGVRASDARERGREWLARVGLWGAEDRYPHQLSGGMRKRVAMAQVLILDPQIVLMDEPFSALDVQTRQLMENELLELWSSDKKSVLFITHDLEEAIAMSDRVVILSAGPNTHPIGDFACDLPRPRDVAEVRMTPRFLDLHRRIWDAMKEEVLKAYAVNSGKRQGA